MINRLLIITYFGLNFLQLMAQPGYQEVASGQFIHHAYSGIGGVPIVNTGTMAFTGGVSFVDIDGDCLDDLTLTTDQGDSLKVYLNRNGHFEQINSIAVDTFDQRMVTWIDYDNDGDKDLFTTSYTYNRLWRNDSNWQFTDVTIAAGLPLVAEPSVMAVWADYDHNGYLDVYVINYDVDTLYTNHLYRNNGNGTFGDVSVGSGTDNGFSYSLAACFLDFDKDGWADLYVANDKFHPNVLYHNNGNGTFADVSVASGTDIVIDAMNAGYGDFDQDGDLDIYVTNGPMGNVLLVNNNNGTFSEADSLVGVGFYNESWAGSFLDVENDGDMDLYVSGAGIGTNAPSSDLFLNNGLDTFITASLPGMIGDTLGSYAHALGDFNFDGFEDIMVVNRSPDASQLWENTSIGGNWLNIIPVGTISNRDGVGVWIEVYAGGQVWTKYTSSGNGFLGQHSNTVHFGIGSNTVIDSVWMYWPSGATSFRIPPINCTYKIIENGGIELVGHIISDKGLYLCSGDTITLDAGYALAHSWSTGENSQTIQVTAPGQYSVVKHCPPGLQAYDTIIIHPGWNPILTDTVTDASCSGLNDGSITVVPSGGIPPYNIIWNSGETDFTINQLSAGYYPFTISDSSNCSYRDSVFVNEPSPLQATIQNTAPVSCADSCDGTLSATVFGGTPPYTCFWPDVNVTDCNVTGLCPGVNMLEVTDANGCVDSFPGLVQAPDTMVLTGGSIPHNHADPGSAWVIVSGGTPPYTYQWDDPLLQTTDTATMLIGDYTYTCIVTDANGCVDSISFYIDMIPGIAEGTHQPPKIYPNPASDVITIELNGDPSGNSHVELVDMTGRLVRSSHFNGMKSNISVATLDRGKYFVRVYNAGRIYNYPINID